MGINKRVFSLVFLREGVNERVLCLPTNDKSIGQESTQGVNWVPLGKMAALRCTLLHEGLTFSQLHPQVAHVGASARETT